jgi:hypothetical protein
MRDGLAAWVLWHEIPDLSPQWNQVLAFEALIQLSQVLRYLRLVVGLHERKRKVLVHVDASKGVKFLTSEHTVLLCRTNLDTNFSRSAMPSL